MSSLFFCSYVCIYRTGEATHRRNSIRVHGLNLSWQERLPLWLLYRTSATTRSRTDLHTEHVIDSLLSPSFSFVQPNSHSTVQCTELYISTRLHTRICYACGMRYSGAVWQKKIQLTLMLSIILSLYCSNIITVQSWVCAVCCENFVPRFKS